MTTQPEWTHGPDIMTPAQWHWLKGHAERIPALFRGLESGSTETSHVMGQRVINGRTVRLSLVVQVVDPGGNPLRSHASVNYPNTAKPPERPTTRHHRRGRPKRW